NQKLYFMLYTVLIDSKLEDLIKQVNDLIQKGWIPQGGFCESSSGAIYHYTQAMIKNSKTQ
ncbi:MAG TPA: hypothetical protein PLB59_01145, partial [Bacteroidales bacterium]|nr:hypothetical protein [Bacteroidales bacterium]